MVQVWWEQFWGPIWGAFLQGVLGGSCVLLVAVIVFTFPLGVVNAIWLIQDSQRWYEFKQRHGLLRRGQE